MSTTPTGEPGTAAGSPTTLTAAAEALHASRHMEPELCVRDGERCGLLSDLAAIEQEARAEAEAEMALLREALVDARTLIESVEWEGDALIDRVQDWSGKADAALAPAATPAPPAPHHCRECDDGPAMTFPEPTPAPPAPGESDDPPLGWPVWRAWFEGMEAQGRYVAPERRSWDTLPEQDRDLDAGIETRVAYFLSQRKVSQPAPGERCAWDECMFRGIPHHPHDRAYRQGVHAIAPEPAP